MDKIDKNSPEYWDKILEKEWLWNLDEEKSFILEKTKNSAKKVLEIENLNYDFRKDEVLIKNWDVLIWRIKYNFLDNKNIELESLYTINWNYNKIISDNWFKEEFLSYFWEYQKIKIPWAWKEILKQFILNYKWYNLTIIPIKSSRGFYNKVLTQFENEWLISIIETYPEYKLFILD